MKNLIEGIVTLIVFPFILLFQLIIVLLVTSWLWAIPVALLIWAIK